MKSILIAASVLFLFSCGEDKSKFKIIYPLTKKSDQTDEYFGTKIPDPYRWLEDDMSENTAQWVKEQNEVTFSFLSKIPFRDKIKDRLKEVWNFPKYSTPFKKGKRYYFYKNDGVQNQSVLYFLDSLNSEPKILLDPNTFSEDGTVALTNFAVSKDGNFAAYGISKAGSDWKEFFVMDLVTGKKLNDHLKNIKFSGISWKNNGFYYTRYDIPENANAFSMKNEFSKVYYHVVGTEQKEDKLIFENKQNAQRSCYSAVTEDERFLILSETETTSGNSLYFLDLENKKSVITQIADGFEYDYNVIDNIEDQLLVLTNDNATNYRLVLIDTKAPQKENWRDIITQQDFLLQSVNIADDKIVAVFLKDVSGKLSIYNLNGEYIRDIELPGKGIVGNFSGSKKEKTAFYSFASFTSPTIIYKYDMQGNESSIYHKAESKFNPGDYVTKQVFYTSKDGTQIPMFITHKKGLKADGNNPCYLYGYGGFNISVTPSFKPDITVFLENGGIYAVANIRGGGEYGKEWHHAGTKLQKQNVFNDFIAAAEYLIDNKYTSASKLAVSGRSNGGLLVGAVMTQRPDLFKVAIPAVGVLDMLRYHKFTIGYAWATDYGTSDEEEHFSNLMKYSPLHNVKENVEYPATLVMTADHDDRVVPAHSFKFISELQEKYKGNNPVMIRVDVNAGHGSGKPVSKQIDEYGDMWAFIFFNLGMEMK
jgi:prolyl oligopeptidase